jgi:ABC-type polysaccharide/polyol phosphate transport system ATPase subunit
VAVSSGRADEEITSGVPDHDAAVVVDGLSKRYPRKRVSLFPPTTSIFERNWFGRRRKASAEPTGGRSSTRARRPTEDVDDDLPFDLDIEDDLDDSDLDDNDDADDGDGVVGASGGDPARPGEMFWALKDISFQLRQGEALGILGEPDAGKSTLLGILGGQVWATEGRALVRDPISPLPAAVVTAITAAGKGTSRFELVSSCRLLGMDPRPIAEHLGEIEELAAPLYTEDGGRAPGALVRLSVATAVIVPSNVVLVEEPAGVDEGFMAEVAERLGERLRAGSAVLFASRRASLVQELCDAALVLSGGVVVDHGGAKSVANRFEAAGRGVKSGGRRRESVTIAPGRYLSEGHELRVPTRVPAFNAAAAIISSTLRTGGGRTKRVDASAEEVFIEIVLETAAPDVEALCGVTFTPRDEQENGIRLELPEPLRFVAPGTYRLLARTQPGVLLAGLYDVRADAIVANPAEREASVIAREIGRVKLSGDDTAIPASAPVAHWDGLSHWRAEAEWSSSRVKPRDGLS